MFGHATEGYGFGPRGEESAWLKHSQMFSKEAQKAMTTETRGQNSRVNYNYNNFTAGGKNRRINPADRPYAEQKVALLPDEFIQYNNKLERYKYYTQQSLDMSEKGSIDKKFRQEDANYALVTPENPNNQQLTAEANELRRKSFEEFLNKNDIERRPQK